ncbi:AEC family transporter [Thermofilum pendens]|uniref:Auxin Efflux Carrier n=1 Tax=Thermofilum pendens (strain DSM 2475 / Hrk 5) TaxID=368408 RepID=A1RYG1_THEPD|nr:AEC family transporter [Thermofilum pendens]ABL78241.1 Auxin Efflux Carrier [Thermofilum pendens Hrk 5]
MIKELLDVYVPIASGLAFGYLSRPGEGELRLFARTVLYVFLTPLLFTSTYQRLSSSPASAPLALTALSASLVVLTFAIATKLHGDPELVLASMYANAGYIPLGIAQSYWGSYGASAVGFYILGNNFASNILAPLALGGESGRLSPRKVLAFPPVYAILAASALALAGVKLPELLLSPLATLGGVAPTVALVQLGMEVGASVDANIVDGLKAYFTRLSVSVPLTLLFVEAGLATGIDAKIAIVESVMPSAVSCVVISRELKLDSRRVAGVVFTSTLVSTLLALPVTLWLLSFTR